MPEQTKDKEPPNIENPSPVAAPNSGDKKRKLHLGLDLGTLQSYFVTKLSKPGTEEKHGTMVPTIVGYPEDGILSGILPGNSKMLHGEDAISNELHLRMVHPLSDGVVSDLDATKSFQSYLRAKVDPDFKREVLCVIGIPAVADLSLIHI